MEGLYLSCKKQYLNYKFNEEIIRNISKKCAKFLYFRRFSEHHKFPIDSQYRYISILSDDICN